MSARGLARRHGCNRTPVGHRRRVTSVTVAGRAVRDENSCRMTATSVGWPCSDRSVDGSRRSAGSATARRSSTRCSPATTTGILRPSVAGGRAHAPACRPGRCTTTSPTSRRCAPRSRSGSGSASRSSPSLDASTTDRDERIEQLVEQRAAFFEAVTPVRRAALLSVHDSPTIAAQPRALDRTLRAPARRVRSRRSTPTRSTRSTPSLSWDTWNRLRTAQGCSVARAAPSPRRRRSARCSKGARDERDPAEQGPVRRAHGRARRGSGRDAQPLEVQGERRRRRASGASEYAQVRRRRRSRWSRTAAARCCGWARADQIAHRRPDRGLGRGRARAVPEPQGVHRDGRRPEYDEGARAPRVGPRAHRADRVHRRAQSQRVRAGV